MIGILVVDDCENDRVLIRRALDKSLNGFKVFEAEDVSNAVAYVEGNGKFSNRSLHPLPELIVCDLTFPRESGFDLIDKIAANGDLKNLSIALMSGSFSSEMRALACQKGACACIDKGDLVYHPEPFLFAIEECLRGAITSQANDLWNA
jgi:CheY-like chemotaxis protein